MKKQEIAKIPYRTAKRADKKFHYIAMQMTHEIKGESHLFVEIFDNTREGRKKPKLRMVFTKKRLVPVSRSGRHLVTGRF